MTPAMGDEGPGYRTSNLLLGAGFRHAFFTRRGGVSEGPYASLNFSASVGDDAGAVSENLNRAARALGVTPEKVYFLSQVHGNVTHVISKNVTREDVLRLEGDAIIGRDGTSAVGVRIADCIPVLVGDRRSGTALAVHAGWKGLVNGVIPRAVARLRETLGNAGELVAAVGPHITVRAFEVSEDVAIQLAACVPGEDVVERNLGVKPHVCLGKIARAQLLATGLEADAVEGLPGCTYSEPEHFFSFRRDGARSGRHLAAIVPRE